MNCPRCQTPVTEADMFCPTCGEQLTYQNTQKPMYCPNCGRPNLATDAFCSVCGTALNKKQMSTGTTVLICLAIVAAIGVASAFIVPQFFFPSNNDDAVPSATPTQTAIAERATYVPIQGERLPGEGAVTLPPTQPPAPKNDGFNTYTDSKFSFSCPYPSGFSATSGVSDFVRYQLKDGSNTIYICATVNDNGRSSQKVADNFKSSHPYTSVISEDTGYNHCSVLLEYDYELGHNYHYCYYSMSGGKIRGFEMTYSADDAQRYAYIRDYMQSNLNLY